MSSQPTPSQIHSQNTPTRHPSCTAPVVPVSRRPHTRSQSLESEDQPTEPNKAQIDDSKPVPSNMKLTGNTGVSITNNAAAGKLTGKLVTTRYVLKKHKRQRTFGCRLCNESFGSVHELTMHHQIVHNILYCDVCNHAFNNPSSLAHHAYSHKELKFKCNRCEISFAFQSQLKAHKVVHKRLADQMCVYPKCGKKFENKGDLTRRTKSHTTKLIQYLDCTYSNVDHRNYDSHRLQHTDIERYWCPDCGKGFKYNTQKQRHISDKNDKNVWAIISVLQA